MYAWIGMRAPALVLAALCAAAPAADGELDASFGVNGLRRAGTTDTYSEIPTAMALQPDGKIIYCGGEGEFANIDFFVVRFTADGDLDTSFSFDGKTTIDFDGRTDICHGVAVQADGKIVVAGTTFPFPDPNADFAVARLNADGTLDTTTFGAGTGKSVVGFDLGGTNDDNGNSVALRPDGRIVVGGSATTATDGLDFAVLQLNADGSRDTSFNLTGRATIGFNLAGGTKNEAANQVAVDSQGRIVLAGLADAGAPGGTDFAAARLLPNGQPDPDFSADGRVVIAFDLGGAAAGNGDGAYTMLLQRDDRIVLGGFADSSPTSTANQDMAVVRLLPDGSLDSSFGIGGRTTIAFDLEPDGPDLVLAMAEQSNGRLVLGGAAQRPATNIILAAAVRLLPNGLPDPGFGTLGKKTYDFGLTTVPGQLFGGVAMQNNKIVFTGVLYVTDLGNVDAYAARVLNDLIFAAGFE